ncbi:MAG: hypothetical protein DRP64_05325 [Verrucomicrobia bacterium]|nr:MAG: hypothetical protein DRP64_05325 [Verrucomicrobiota bacterium]
MSLRIAGLLGLSFLLFTFAVFAEPSESLLVKNVLLAGSDDGAEDQVVSLLVENGLLDMVTVDSFPDEKIDLVVDAQQGVVLGKLNVGEPASFMILDEDPRVNFEALLDTQTHAVFVLKEGVIVRNRLLPAPLEPDKPVSENPQEWFAYSTPPMALSTFYKNAGKWNRFRSKYVNATFLAALALDRMAWLDQDGTSEGQSGDLSTYDGGEIRALRFGMVGSLNFENPWIFTFFAATTAFDKGFDSTTDDGFGVFDVRLDIPFYQDSTLSIGKQKEPISMERLSAMINLPMQERSAVSDAMMASRNVGIVLSGTGFDRRTSWAGGVFNPWLDAGTSIGDTSTQLIGRGTVIPQESTNKKSLFHLGAGLRYSNAKSGVRYSTEPEFNQAPLFVDTGMLAAESTMLYDLEAAWRWGPFLLNGEYVINRVDAPADGDPTFTGYHVTANYVLTGEMRPYNKRSGLFRPVPVSKPVNDGGWGAWELSARYSNLDLDEGTVNGGDLDIYSLGLKWWLSTSASVDLNYRHIVLEDVAGTGHSDGLMTRIVLILE